MQCCQELFRELLLKPAGCKTYMCEHLVGDVSISKVLFISHIFNASELGAYLCSESVLLQVGMQVQCFSEWHLPASFVGGGQSETQTPVLKAPGDVLTALPPHPKRDQEVLVEVSCSVKCLCLKTVSNLFVLTLG